MSTESPTDSPTDSTLPPAPARIFELNAAADQLERQATVIEALATGVSTESSRWRPSADAWSLLEVVGHLLDEEREDFRARLHHLLGTEPDEPMPHIDPQGWVTVRDYNSRELEPVLGELVAERKRSVAWLRSLESPSWDNVHHHQSGFDIRAGDMLAAWVDHDLLHIRQLTELRHDLLVARSAPYLTIYAGEW